jgi:hypothetical protein
VETITIREAKALCACWERTPPAHESLAILLSVQTTWKPPESKSKTPATPSSEEDVRAFIAAVTGAV